MFDRRIVPEPVLALVRAIQSRAECTLGGGAALSGVHLHHRLSHDIDLFCDTPEGVRELAALLPSLADEAGMPLTLARDGRTHVRFAHTTGSVDVDVVWEQLPAALRDESVEGLRVRSYAALRASKLTCLLSRAEPRDLVDIMFAERMAPLTSHDFEAALSLDGGFDPGMLAWLLESFPVAPLPMMLAKLTAVELDAYRTQLAHRLRTLASGT